MVFLTHSGSALALAPFTFATCSFMQEKQEAHLTATAAAVAIHSVAIVASLVQGTWRKQALKRTLRLDPLSVGFYDH